MSRRATAAASPTTCPSGKARPRPPTPGAANLHRNVFFRTAQVPATVMSALDLNNEEKLWGWLASLESQGMPVMAIPHNSNASMGRTFPDLSAAGSPIDAGYARRRAHFEPLIEMMQVR
jgi:hypothetical protein